MKDKAKKEGAVSVKEQIRSRFTEGNFRYPAGAVPADTTIDFEIEISRAQSIRKATLVWIDDEENRYKYLNMDWSGINRGHDVYTKVIKVNKRGLNWYYFQLETLSQTFYVGKEGLSIVVANHEPPSWPLIVYNRHFTTPNWIKGGLFYHIFVDRFARVGVSTAKENVVLREDWGGTPVYLPNEKGEIVNNDFFGGNLKGVLEKLDYLQQLGVTCIYLSPIFEAYSNHKYDTGDFTKIDSMFGSIEDFHLLCKEGKKRGIRIVLDGVFNHTGSDSIYFNKNGTYDSIGAFQSKESPYFSWFTFIEYPDKYESWWGIDTLPAVNEDDPDFLQFITGTEGIARKWLKLGASGWRLDVLDELPDTFIEAFRKAAKSYDQETLLIGEVWEDASYKMSYGKRRRYLLGEQMDSIMNYPFMDAIIQFVRNGDAEKLHEVVTTILQHYPSCVVHCLMNMLGTHDTKRILTALGGRIVQDAPREQQAQMNMSASERKEAIHLLKMASLIQMTLPGVPCIYYGDEAGLEGYEDPFNRRCFPWGKEEKTLQHWYKSLGTIRKQWSVFKEGQYETLYAKEQVFLFQRFNGLEKVIVGVNRSDIPFQIEITAPYVDLLQNRDVSDEYMMEPNTVCFLGKKSLC